jgi:hypothetical protein
MINRRKPGGAQGPGGASNFFDFQNRAGGGPAASKKPMRGFSPNFEFPTSTEEDEI